MSDLKNKTNRYQNPEVFEQLAIEYAVGSLRGRARKRFEVLMDTHFYLRAVVEAYEIKFANLVELLPDAKPSNQVWSNIEKHIKATPAQQIENKTVWWKGTVFKQRFAFAAMALIVSAVMLLNPMTLTPTATATAYNAILKSESEIPMAITEINKSDLSLSVNVVKPIYVPDGKELTLWCNPKTGDGMPMKMGTISKSGVTRITISKKEWQNMKNVGVLTISVEQKGNTKIREPAGKILLKGMLSTSQ